MKSHLEKLINYFVEAKSTKRSVFHQKRKLSMESLENRELLTVVGFAGAQDAYEGSMDGYFRLYRDDTTNELTVHFEVSNFNTDDANYTGWAKNGTDFSFLPGTGVNDHQGEATFFAGQQYLDIQVTVIDDPWVEGNEKLRLNLLSSANYDIGDGEGTALVTIHDNEIVAGMNLIPYTPETKYIDPMEIPEEKWKVNEVGVRRNGDFDDGNIDPDWYSITATTDENDLIQLDIDILPSNDVEYWFRASDAVSDVRFWYSDLKGNEFITINGGTQITSDITIYAEYISAGDAHVTFELAAIDAWTSGVVLTEEIIFRPFESVTCAFVGEFQTPGDAEVSPGINDWVIQQLLDGYDVHVWDDGHDKNSTESPRGDVASPDCDPTGQGNALNEIANAINNRGVTDVAIVGYSHGGGSTYNLSQAMHHDGTTVTITHNGNLATITYPDLIKKNYNLVFTSYIDAINNSSFTSMTAETRRPLNSQFHVNQYQRNTGLLGLKLRGNNSGGDDDIDRSYLGVTHSTIDDNEIVLAFLTMRFKQKVRR